MIGSSVVPGLPKRCVTPSSLSSARNAERPVMRFMEALSFPRASLSGWGHHDRLLTDRAMKPGHNCFAAKRAVPPPPVLPNLIFRYRQLSTASGLCHNAPHWSFEIAAIALAEDLVDSCRTDISLSRLILIRELAILNQSRRGAAHHSYVYPVHVTTRKSFGLMTRKLSVTESHRLAQFRGTFSRTVHVPMTFTVRGGRKT